MADKEVIASTDLTTIKKVLTLTARKRPNNIVFGTDYAMCSIREHIELVELLEIERQAKDKIFSGDAIKLSHLKL